MSIPGILQGVFEHDRAVVQMQQGNVQGALSLLQKSMSNNPDDASLLYDTGVAAYKAGDHAQAGVCFERVLSLPNVDKKLMESTYFNVGNVHAALKEYRRAIDAYTKVLEYDAHHERALHNRAVVQKRLEQEEQERKKEEEEKKEKEKKNQEEQDKNKKEQEEQRDENTQESSPQGSSSQDQQKVQDEENKSAQAKKEKSMKSPAQQAQAHQEKITKQDKKEMSTGQGAKETKEGNKQDMSDEQKMNALLAHVLEEREKQDASSNKKLIRQSVAQQAVDTDHEHNW